MRIVRHLSARRCLDAFVDDELPEAAVFRVLRHLDECPGCVEEVRSVHWTKTVISRHGAGAAVETAAVGRLEQWVRTELLDGQNR